MLNESFGDAIHRYAIVNNIKWTLMVKKCLDVSYSSLINQLSAVSLNGSAADGSIKRIK